MKKHWLLLAASAAATSGCYDVSMATNSDVSSFRVVVQSLSAVTDSGSLQALTVVPSCIKQYGTKIDQVPVTVRGTDACHYMVPNSQVEMQVDVTALDKAGKAMDFNGPVSFKVVPGDVDGAYSYAWVNLSKGRGVGKLRARHLYGQVRVWAADEPVQLQYATDGSIAGDQSQLPVEPAARTYSAGASDAVFFQEPTLADVQKPQTTSSDASPFQGQFITLGRAPESGSIQYQNCPDIDLNGDGKVDPQPPLPVTLLVTGTDPSGFFVTDLTSCPMPEDTTSSSVNVPEPSGYLPGRFGSMYIYNYSYPAGIDPGDLLWTLAGSIQEFTNTTQLTFPSWTVREHVRELPPSQWNKYLDQDPPVELVQRHCGHKNTLALGAVDTLCGYYTGNMKLESLESALVTMRSVRFPQVFKNCDLNGDGTVPSFCSRSSTWTYCSTSAPPDNNEVQCNIDCSTGSGDYKNTVCSERSQFITYGQYIVEMTGSGPREAGLDDSLSARTLTVGLSASASGRTASGFEDGAQVNVWCDVDTYYRVGTSSVSATSADTLLPAKSRQTLVIGSGQGYVAFLAQNPPGSSPAPSCYVGRNSHTRVLLITKDAVPELKVDCDEKDADATRARQCTLLHQATYDVVGHLRQVQAARPRWMVMPRDVDDICCHPGPGLECPNPIKPCE